MKRVILSMLLLFTYMYSTAQENERKIIIDVTSTNSKVYQSILLTLRIMTESHPDTEFDVIAYGEAVPMMMKNQSVVGEQILQYVRNDKVHFTACEVSMALFDIKKEQLLEGVRTVENAVDEIVIKQTNGWGYIKSGN